MFEVLFKMTYLLCYHNKAYLFIWNFAFTHALQILFHFYDFSSDRILAYTRFEDHIYIDAHIKTKCFITLYNHNYVPMA